MPTNARAAETRGILLATQLAVVADASGRRLFSQGTIEACEGRYARIGRAEHGNYALDKGPRCRARDRRWLHVALAHIDRVASVSQNLVLARRAWCVTIALAAMEERSPLDKREVHLARVGWRCTAPAAGGQ